jgi:leader peptidase (prepilin peptidase)/N-methyltransferase
MPVVVNPPLIALLAVFGLIVGSFLNVCIGRLPAGESIVSPGSRCPRCRTPIRWYDNIPVLSYLLLGGCCRVCREPISLRYPLVELATAAAFVAQGIAFGDDPLRLISRLVLTGLLIALFGTDLETERLPNVLTVPGTVTGLAFSFFLPPGFVASVIGAAVGAGVLLLIRWLWQRARGVDAMGLGDVKMLAMIGAFLGWQQVGVVLFLASVAGAVIGVALAAGSARTMQSRLPFGTFLAVAAFAASLVGEPFVAWYLNLYR